MLELATTTFNDCQPTKKPTSNSWKKNKPVTRKVKLHIEVFHLKKLLVPSVQIGIHMYFNQPDLFLNVVALHGRLTAADVKMELYLCQVRINASLYKELMQTIDSGKAGVLPDGPKWDQNLQNARRSAAFWMQQSISK